MLVTVPLLIVAFIAAFISVTTQRICSECERDHTKVKVFYGMLSIITALTAVFWIMTHS